MPLRVLKFWGVTRPKMSCFEPWILDATGDGRGLQVVLPSNVLSHFVSCRRLPCHLASKLRVSPGGKTFRHRFFLLQTWSSKGQWWVLPFGDLMNPRSMTTPTPFQWSSMKYSHACYPHVCCTQSWTLPKSKCVKRRVFVASGTGARCRVHQCLFFGRFRTEAIALLTKNTTCLFNIAIENHHV